jgi:hypothetical protein
LFAAFPGREPPHVGVSNVVVVRFDRRLQLGNEDLNGIAIGYEVALFRFAGFAVGRASFCRPAK